MAADHYLDLDEHCVSGDDDEGHDDDRGVEDDDGYGGGKGKAYIQNSPRSNCCYEGDQWLLTTILILINTVSVVMMTKVMMTTEVLGMMMVMEEVIEIVKS